MENQAVTLRRLQGVASRVAHIAGYHSVVIGTGEAGVEAATMQWLDEIDRKIKSLESEVATLKRR